MIDGFYFDRIDSRIIDICEQAERNYYLTKNNNKNRNSTINIQSQDNGDGNSEYIQRPKNTNSQNKPLFDIQDNEIIKLQTVQSTQRSDINNNTPYKEIDISQTQIDDNYFDYYTKKPIEVYHSYKGPYTTRQNESIAIHYNNPNANSNDYDNNIKTSLFNIPLIEFSKENIHDINQSIKMKSSHNANPFNLSYNSIQSMNTTNNKFPSLQRSCLSCELQSKINDNSIYHKDLNKKLTTNKSINTFLIKAKINISKSNYTTAYDQLRPLIVQGLYHSDLFYLYGEVCRLIKRMEEAEEYLLLSLNFAHHSPYVYYSLGLLYQEVAQLKYSNSFLKKFNIEIETAEAHFELAKNYFAMKKYLKSADQSTKAILLNPNIPYYYNLRSEVYYKIGLDDMAKEDINTMEGIIFKQ